MGPRLAYVAARTRFCVEDFDSRGNPADVTYCPKWNFASAGAPPGRFARLLDVGFVWHRACSFSRQAARPRPNEIRTRRAETLLHKTSKQATMSPAKAGLSFFIDCNRPPRPLVQLRE